MLMLAKSSLVTVPANRYLGLPITTQGAPPTEDDAEVDPARPAVRIMRKVVPGKMNSPEVVMSALKWKKFSLNNASQSVL